MTPLEREIRDRIALDGPIGVADYMQLCLAHPTHGYYRTRDPLGRGGDFTTAPEISQMFGELIGLWAAECWIGLGRPDPVLLVELGPGRGTLMADALRAAAIVPGFLEAARVHLVETSPALRAVQAQALHGRAVTWHDDLEEIPEGPILLVANEFFDALAVRQVVRGESGWHERVVGVSGDRLAFGLAPDRLPDMFGPEPAGSLIELRPEGARIAAGIGSRLARFGGTALIVDYGYSGPARGDTLQAVRRHAFADPLEAPGEADLTAHVDFTALARAAEGHARVFGPVEQGAFLNALGIEARAERLKARADAAQAAAIEAALHRLTAPEAMGRLFKALVLAGPGFLPPPFQARTR